MAGGARGAAQWGVDREALMKHPHHAVDAVLDFEPETTGQPVVVGQPPPPMQESLHGAPAPASPHEAVPTHDPVPTDAHLPDGSGAPDRF